jgi:hypothetical protein
MFSPNQTYSNSKLYSPYQPSPGSTTPKKKGTKSRTRNMEKSGKMARTQHESNTMKDSEAFASLTRNLAKPLERESKEYKEEEKQQIDANQDFDILEREDQKQKVLEAGEEENLSRATFGIKTKGTTKQSSISAHEFETLKIQLQSLIQEKENELNQKYAFLVEEVNKRTQAINNLKRILVSRLREVESTFIEANQEFQRSLEVDAMLESSNEERGESEIALLREERRKIEKELIDLKDTLEVKQKEVQDFGFQVKKLQRDNTNYEKELKATLSKQKACELDNQMKDFENKSLEKSRTELKTEVNALKQRIINLEERNRNEHKKFTQELEKQVLKMQSNESKALKGALEKR